MAHLALLDWTPQIGLGQRRRAPKVCFIQCVLVGITLLSALTAPVIRRTLILGMCLLLVGCHQDPKRQAEKHYAKAQYYIAQNQMEAALIELGRTVQLSPEMPKPHHDLGKLYLQLGQVNNGIRELFLAIRYNPEDQEAYEIVGEHLLRTGNFSQAKDVAAKFVEKWPENRVAQMILIEGLIGTGDLEHARSLADELVQDDPKNARVRFDLARLQLQEKQWSEAEKNLRLSWQLDPKRLTAGLVLSRLVEVHGNTSEAESVLKRMAELRPDSVEPLYALAAFYLRNGRIVSAEETFKQIQAVGHANPRDRGSLAAFYGAVGRPQEAEKELHRVLADAPTDSLNWRRLAQIEIDMNRRDVARQIVNDLVKKDSADWEALLILGRLDVDDGKPEQALKELEQARKVQPYSPQIDFQTARSYLSQGRVDLAKNAVAAALKMSPDLLPAKVLMADLELRSGRTQSAIQILNQALKQRPSVIEPYLLLSQAYAIEGAYQLAEENLSRMVSPNTSARDQAIIFQALAWVKFRQGHYGEAIQLCTKSLNMGPLTRDGLRLLGLSYLGTKQPELGLRTVETFLHKADNWPAGQQVLGELALQANKLDVADLAFQKELQLDPKSSAALFGMGELQRARGHYDLAREFFERYAAAEPGNATVHAQLGGLAELNRDWALAISEYQKALELDRSLAIAKNNLAWLYAEHGGSVTVALQLAQEARSSLPHDPHVADTLGWILVKAGSPESALPYLKESVAKIPGNAAYHYHLGVAYFQSSKNPEAKRELQTALSLQQSFEGSIEAKKTLELANAAPN